jgi:PAS domain S-box-containing protein
MPEATVALGGAVDASLLPIVRDRVGVPPAGERSSVSILIVDDNYGKRLSLKAILKPLGFSIVEADSGVAALRCLMGQDFAVILLDVCMPGMDGFDTAALIRTRRESEMTPIIFITAFGSDEIIKIDRYAQGAVDFIVAPVPADELRAKVSVFANLFIKAELLAAQAREVQASADRLRLLTDAAPIGIFHTDAQNRYIYTNPRWSEITGMPAEQAVGQDWTAIIASQQRAGLHPELSDGEMDGAEISHRFELRPLGSAVRTVLATSKPIPDGAGGIEGWVGTLADITAEAGAETAMSNARDEANAASQLKSDFLANMSHEIRTPMNGVIGMTDLLLETNLDPYQRDYAQTVRNSGEALLTIINDILDFSKVEAGKLEIEDIEFDLRTIVGDVVDLLSGPAQAEGIELVAAIDRAVPATVSGDPGRVRQVLTNLIGNAIKFTHVGQIVLRVAAAEIAGTETIIRFEVADTGVGIAPEKLATVFHPFVQADTSTSRKYGGTGLGLAISSQLVALMGGDCGVTSHLGVGSTFWFTITVHAHKGGPEAPLVNAAALAGISALIVDDNAAQLDAVSAQLIDCGMSVATADSGLSALAMLRAAQTRGEPIAVTLIDRFMPDMDGQALIDAIVADPDLSTRLILVTGLAQEYDLGQSAASAVCASLSKPVHRDDLLACLRVALRLTSGEVTPEALAAPWSSPSGQPGPGRLLLAEDNLINQKVAVAMLSGAGYTVDTVLDGAAAVAAVAAQRYDAILMDCQLPEMNGYEATMEIRTREQGSARRVPIIAMTAGARPEDRERCSIAGMDGYLSKPVSKDVLLALVARSIRHAQLGEDAAAA